MDPILEMFFENDTTLASSAVFANIHNICQSIATDAAVMHGFVSEEFNIDCESNRSNIDFYEHCTKLSDLEFITHFRMERPTMQV